MSQIELPKNSLWQLFQAKKWVLVQGPLRDENGEIVAENVTSVAYLNEGFESLSDIQEVSEKAYTVVVPLGTLDYAEKWLQNFLFAIPLFRGAIELKQERLKAGDDIISQALNDQP